MPDPRESARYTVNPSARTPPAAGWTGTKADKIIYMVISILVVVSIVLGMMAIAIVVGVARGIRSRASSDSGSSAATEVSDLTTGVITGSTTIPGTTNFTIGCSPKNTTSVLGRVINSVTGIANSWPWMVYLSINSGRLCGGSLIGYQHVVTAAHFVKSPTSELVNVHMLICRNDLRQQVMMDAARPRFPVIQRRID
jgi:hypothetical protein